MMERRKNTLPDNYDEIIKWWETVPNSRNNEVIPNRIQLLVKYFEDGVTRAITPETLQTIYEGERKEEFNQRLSKILIEPSKKAIKLQKRLERMDSYHDKVFEIALLLLDKIAESGDTKEVASEKLQITEKRLKKILRSRANLKISEIVLIEKNYNLKILNLC
jgi:hypothetical protein